MLESDKRRTIEEQELGSALGNEKGEEGENADHGDEEKDGSLVRSCRDVLDRKYRKLRSAEILGADNRRLFWLKNPAPLQFGLSRAGNPRTLRLEPTCGVRVVSPVKSSQLCGAVRCSKHDMLYLLPVRAASTRQPSPFPSPVSSFHPPSMKTPPLSAPPQQAAVASSVTAFAGGGGGGGGGGESADRADGPRSPAVASAYSGMFHRNSDHLRSKTATGGQERGAGHRPQRSAASNAVASALGIPRHRQHHHGGGGGGGAAAPSRETTPPPT